MKNDSTHAIIRMKARIERAMKNSGKTPEEMLELWHKHSLKDDNVVDEKQPIPSMGELMRTMRRVIKDAGVSGDEAIERWHEYSKGDDGMENDKCDLCNGAVEQNYEVEINDKTYKGHRCCMDTLKNIYDNNDVKHEEYIDEIIKVINYEWDLTPFDRISIRAKKTMKRSGLTPQEVFRRMDEYDCDEF